MSKQVVTQIFSGGNAYDIWDNDAHAGLANVVINTSAVSAALDEHKANTNYHFSEEGWRRLDTAETNINTLDASLSAHIAETEKHITAEERTFWNSKVDNEDMISATSGKADKTYVNEQDTALGNRINKLSNDLADLANGLSAHANDTSVHVQEGERDYWNTVSAKLDAKDLTSAHSAFGPFITADSAKAYANTASANAFNSASAWVIQQDYARNSEFANYYKKSETSGRNQLSDAFNAKQDSLNFQLEDERVVGLKLHTSTGGFSAIGYEYTAGDANVTVNNNTHEISLTKDFLETSTFNSFSASQTEINFAFQTNIDALDDKIDTVSAAHDTFSAFANDKFAEIDEAIDEIATGLDAKADKTALNTVSATFNTYSAAVANPIQQGVAASAWIADNNDLVHTADISDMATQTWVESKNYLSEHQSLADYYKKNETSGASQLSTKFTDVTNCVAGVSAYITAHETQWAKETNVKVTSNDGTVSVTSSTQGGDTIYDLHVTPGAGGGTNINASNGISAEFNQATSAWNIGLSEAGGFYYAKTTDNAVQISATDEPQNIFEGVNGESVPASPFWEFKANSDMDIVNGCICIPMDIDSVSLNVGVTFDWDQRDNEWYNFGIALLTPDDELIDHVYNYAPSEVCKATSDLNISWKNDDTFAKCISAVSGSNRFPDGTRCNVFKICYCPLNHENSSQTDSKYATTAYPENCWATVNIGIRENEASFNSYEPAKATDGKVNAVAGDTPNYLTVKIKPGLGISKTTTSDGGTGTAIELGIDVADANPGQVLKYTADNTIAWADDVASQPTTLVNTFTSSDSSVNIDTYIEEGVQKVNFTLNNDYENVATPARPFDKIITDSAVSFVSKTSINDTDAMIFPMTFPSGRFESISFFTQAFDANTYVSVAIYGNNVDKIDGAHLWFSMLDQRIGSDELIDLANRTTASNFVFTNKDGLPAIVKRIGQAPNFTKFTFNWVVLAIRNTTSSGTFRLWSKSFTPGGNENILNAGFAFMPNFGSTNMVITNGTGARQFAETFSSSWHGLTELINKSVPYIQFNVVK